MSDIGVAENSSPLEILGCLVGWAAVQIGLLDPEDKDTRLLRTGETAHQKKNFKYQNTCLIGIFERFLLAQSGLKVQFSKHLNLLSRLKTQGLNLLLSYALTFWHRSFTFNSNKSPNWCNSFLVYYPDVCLQLNVFRPAGPTTNTARLSPRYEGKTRGCHCSHWAPDDGRENARIMLSCKQTSG